MLDDLFGSIGLSPRQFRELILNYVIAMHIRRRVGELLEEDRPDLEELERHLLSMAPGFAAEDLVERKEDGLYPSRQLEELCHELLDEHNNEEFWARLETELAARDYLAGLDSAARLEAKSSGEKAPEHILLRYREEFDKYGSDRLVIDTELKALEEE